MNSITEINRSFPFSPSQFIEFLWGEDMYNKIYAKSEKGVKTNFSDSENLKVKVLISNEAISDISSKIILKPYQNIWISNK